jgi:pterin-4a-carbinolamine dehydratase
VAAVAESLGHHPNIRLHEWCFVELEIYSHVSGGLTTRDVELSMAIDRMLDDAPPA